MTKTLSILVLATLTIAIATLACNRGEPQEQAPPATSASPNTPVDATPATSDVEEVGYEAAYPDDVSTEDLTEEDATQQKASHSHGGGEEHTHGDAEEHAHAADGADDQHEH